MGSPNPLADSAPTDPEDHLLVTRARSGEREALETLVERHQTWISNIALRMLSHPQDAEDATQEILVKAFTTLSSFEGRSSFRTWLYRIVVNHVLNIRRGRREPEALTFGCYAHGLDTTPDLDPPDQNSLPVDVRLLVDEAKISCTTGMLLCLAREQRLVYILGEIFEVSDAVGAELLDISQDNFRQRPDSRPPGSPQLHERQVRAREGCEPVPLRAKDTRLRESGLRGSAKPVVRTGLHAPGSRRRTRHVRSDRDARRAVRGHLPAAPVL